MFYHFSQNNSGGTFSFDEEDGITHHVIIEADNPSEANFKAEKIGLYFNGCDSGMDCDCCGDRWHEVDKYDASDKPEVYGDEPSNVSHKWMDDGKEVAIHYKNGVIEWF